MCVFARTSVEHEKNHLSGVADRNPLVIYSPIVDTNVCELIKKGEANGETEGFKRLHPVCLSTPEKLYPSA